MTVASPADAPALRDGGRRPEEKAVPSKFSFLTAELNFWKAVDNGEFVMDYTHPEAVKMGAELAGLEDGHHVPIHNVRGQEDVYSLEVNGFQYAHHPVSAVTDWSDQAHVTEKLVPETEKLVRELTGATRTLVFQSRVRCFATHSKQMADSQAPALSIHGDLTQDSIEYRLSKLFKPDEVERIMRGRFQAINVWRPLKTIRKDPLAVCDFQSVSQVDIQQQKMILRDDWFGITKLKFNPAQKWYYLDGQTRDEALVFKQYDNRADKGAMIVPHTAFVDARYVDDEPRVSIEIKMWAFHDDEAA